MGSRNYGLKKIQRSLSGFGKEPEKYAAPVIQNELLEAMALGVMRQISANIQNATLFTIMPDETEDVSNKEQLIICIPLVDDCFVIHEDFIGIHSLDKCSDLSCTTKYALTEEPKTRVELTWATCSPPPPPQSFYACYGPWILCMVPFRVALLRHCFSVRFA